jgi:hypothetical protein
MSNHAKRVARDSDSWSPLLSLRRGSRVRRTCIDAPALRRLGGRFSVSSTTDPRQALRGFCKESRESTVPSKISRRSRLRSRIRPSLPRRPIASRPGGSPHAVFARSVGRAARAQSRPARHPPNPAKLHGGDVSATIDFRQIYQAVLENWLPLHAPHALGGQFPSLDLFDFGGTR